MGERYHEDLATAFARGRLGDESATIADGVAAGLRLHKFKRDTVLPRVQRVTDLDAVRRGGVARLTALRMDASQMNVCAGEFRRGDDAGVLEHMPAPVAALRCGVVARRTVVISVPSVPDDNPEHLHLFLSTGRRRELLAGGPVVSVPVLGMGCRLDLESYMGRSKCSSREMMEGLY